MDDLLGNLSLGFSVALHWHNVLLCFGAVLLGTAIGVLPGIGPMATMALLFPLTYYLAPESALIMLAGIYYGAQYGGSTTAILLNLPGEASSAVTCIDGYQMARKGRAGTALAVAAVGSFFAGTVSTAVLASLAPFFAEVGLAFRAPDFFALMLFGLIGSIILANGSPIKAVGMILLGMLLGFVGTDVTSGTVRYSFDVLELVEGIDFVAIAVGLFGIGEIIVNLVRRNAEGARTMAPVAQIGITMADFRRAWPAVLRGTGIGSLLGVLPGGGATLSSFASYAVEKRISRHREEFGHGAIEGVAGPESANNAGAQTSFIPMLTLGLPSNVLMAIMMGALMLHGIAPGPNVMHTRPGLVWGLICSMWLGNLILVIINLPLISIWVKLLSVPYRLLFPAVVVFCCVGVFSVSNSNFNVLLAAAFGIAGFVLAKLECEVAPFALGFILGPPMEENLRRAMLVSEGDITVFMTRPISATLLAATVLLILMLIFPTFRRTREVAFRE